jgi:type I restriction-modification system DNA methylase subunit
MTTSDIELAPDGRIVDFLDGVPLADTPRERVRQRVLRALHVEHGYPKAAIRRDAAIVVGSDPALDDGGAPMRADIVVYRSPPARRRGDQGEIALVVECAAPGQTEDHGRLVAAILATSAGGGVWTDGDGDVRAFRRRGARVEPAPGPPCRDEGWDAVGRRRRDQLERPRDVRGLLRLCHNRLHGRGIDGDEEDLAMDMVRIVLAKAQDETGSGARPEFACTAEEYGSAEGRRAVAGRVQRLFRAFADANPGVFAEHERIGVSPAAITEVVVVLQPYALTTRLDDADEWDVVGSAYEQYAASHLKRQRGQFFTNRLLVELMVRVLDPDADVTALDPAGGSGGFLTGVLRHVRRTAIAGGGGAAADERRLRDLGDRLFLVEASPRLVKIAKAAMLLSGDGHAGMTRGDGLGPYDALDDRIRERCARGTPTLILTNPPFAGQNEGLVTDPAILADYAVARLLDGAPPEMLFFERCLDWLAPGGRLGIVMPKSFLDTATYRPARELLFRDAQLLAVLNCHKNTFQPDTGVRTCVVFLRKLEAGEKPPADHDIFMAISRKIGRDSEGRPIFKIDPDGETTEEIDHDLEEILDDWREAASGALQSSGYRFVVRRGELDAALNINPQRYLPHLNESLREIQEMDDRGGWTVTSMSQIEQGITIFKGPRLRTEPLIVEGPDDAGAAEPYYTPSAVLQDRRDSVKWLDLARAGPGARKRLEKVRVQAGDLLVTRSGSIGRVAYVTRRLHGAIVSDDAIRVRIADEDLRAYVFAYLQSAHAQNQLRRNEYGAVQQHLEPDHVGDLLVPIPDDWSRVRAAVDAAKEHFASKEKAESAAARMAGAIAEAIGGDEPAALVA